MISEINTVYNCIRAVVAKCIDLTTILHITATSVLTVLDTSILLEYFLKNFIKENTDRNTLENVS